MPPASLALALALAGCLLWRSGTAAQAVTVSGMFDLAWPATAVPLDEGTAHKVRSGDPTGDSWYLNPLEHVQN